ncbi:AfsR/SARP family transcriptional regulator [Streptomyces sp. NPDC047072]|uniref:AfsR/SARP family transcriptional regulator n=1 Tax=Streptomyces sp. NPDC047072 TaxID=3154809 RepID=UPI0033D81025
MRFHVLGPLEITESGANVPFNGVKQCAALGLLLFRANKIVAVDEFVRTLWPNGAPPTARKILQNAASAIRRLLDCGEREPGRPELLTHPSGYLLKINPQEIDYFCFIDHITEGQEMFRQARFQDAVLEFRSALSLWRGPALSEILTKGISWPELETLENTVSMAFEYCMDAELACGRDRQLICEIKQFLKGSPTRERVVGQLMIVLYRAGRQVDALETFQRFRCRLREEYGLDPQQWLQELHNAILTQSPALGIASIHTGVWAQGSGTAEAEVECRSEVMKWGKTGETRVVQTAAPWSKRTSTLAPETASASSEYRGKTEDSTVATSHGPSDDLLSELDTIRQALERMFEKIIREGRS